MRSPWTAGGLLKGAIDTMSTGRRAMATLVMVISIKWNFPERGRTVGEVLTGVAGQRVDGTGLNTTGAELPLDTGVGIVAGT